MDDPHSLVSFLFFFFFIVGLPILTFSFYPLNLSLFSKYLSFAPSVGCDPSQGFFLKENILPGSKWDCKG
jgi:hypothetical protein